MSILFRQPNKFRLIDVEQVVLSSPNYIEFDVDPKQFDGVRIVMPRDKQNHGISYEFSDGEIELIFDVPTGQNLIKKIYNLRGCEALIGFQYRNSQTSDVFIDLLIDFYSEVVFTADGVRCSINKKNFNESIETRYDTKLDLLGNKNLDGNTITPASPVTVTLPNKDIILQSSWKINPALQNTGFFIHTHSFITDVVTPWQIETSEIQTTQSPVAGVFTVTDSPDRGIILTGSQITGITGRDFTVNGRIRFDVKIIEANESPQFSVALMVVDPSGPTFSELVIGVGTFQGATTGTRTFDFNISNTILQDVPFDNYIAFALRFGDSGALTGAIYSVDVTYDVGVSELKFTEVTEFPESTSGHLYILDALNKGFEMVTGQDTPVRSTFFGRLDRGYPEDGCGAEMSVTSGKKVRNFPDADITTSMKKLYSEVLRPMYNLGLAYENQSGTELVRIEEMKYFYQEEVGFRFSDVFDYEETPYLEYIFNEVKIEFKKYLEEEINTLDSVHTRQEYLTPIKRHKNRLDIEIDAIMDPYAFEYTRRLQFNEKPTESWRYDDDLFMMQLIVGEGLVIVGQIPNETIDLQMFSPVNGQVTVAGDHTSERNGASHIQVDYQAGSVNVSFTASIVNTATDGVSFTVIGFENPDRTLNDVTGAFGTVFFKKFEDSAATPEFSEKFDLVEGVIDPDSFANLRHTPKSILMRYGGLLKSGLYFQDVIDVVQNTFFKNNGDLKTRLKADDPCRLHRRISQTIYEKEQLIINNLGDESKYFLPEIMKFKAKINWEDLLTIKNNRYNILQLTDSAGTLQSGWIKPGGAFSYNPGNELLVECELIKKA